MQNQYKLQVIKDGDESQSFSLEDSINFSYSNDSLALSDTESDILIQVNDDNVSFKLNTALIDKATINSQELKLKAIYFLNHDESVQIGDVALKIVDESRISSESNNDGATLVMSLEDIQNAQSDAPKKTNENHVQPRELKSNGTTTSIDISKLLRSEGLIDETKERKKKSQADLKVKNINFSVDHNHIEEDEDEGPEQEDASETKKSKAKSHKRTPKTKKLELDKTSKNKKKDVVDNSNLFGVFSRLFATITDFLISLLLVQVIKHPVLDRNIYQWTGSLNKKIKSFEIGTIDIDFVKLFVIFIALRILSNIIFSVGLSAFLMGATTEGSFFTKRIKSLFRAPLEILSLLAPFIDFSLILGRRTLKEIITVGKIKYRLQFLKYLSFFIFITILVSVTAYKPIERYLKYKTTSSYREVTPIENEYALSIFSLSDNYKVNYHIDGVNSERPYYLMVNKYDGSTIFIQTINKYPYENLVKNINKVPLAHEIYPFASRYKSDTKITEKHKKEFMNFLFLGKYMQNLQLSKFIGLPLLAANFTIEDHLIERAKTIVELTNGTFVINNSFFYFPDKTGIKVLRVLSSQKIVEIYNEIILSDQDKSEKLPLERLLENKSIDGVKTLNYLEQLDQVYKTAKSSRQGLDKQNLKNFLQSILVTLDQYNDIQYLSLRNSINSMIRRL